MEISMRIRCLATVAGKALRKPSPAKWLKDLVDAAGSDDDCENDDEEDDDNTSVAEGDAASAGSESDGGAEL